MRVLSQYDLVCCTKAELSLLLHQVTAELPNLPEGSHQLQNEHLNRELHSYPTHIRAA